MYWEKNATWIFLLLVSSRLQVVFILTTCGCQVHKYKSKVGTLADRISHANLEGFDLKRVRKSWEGLWFGAMKLRPYIIKGVKWDSSLVGCQCLLGPIVLLSCWEKACLIGSKAQQMSCTTYRHSFWNYSTYCERQGKEQCGEDLGEGLQEWLHPDIYCEDTWGEFYRTEISTLKCGIQRSSSHLTTLPCLS